MTADAAAKILVSWNTIDAGGDLNPILHEDLQAASIDDACKLNNNAHEHPEWLIHPVPALF